VTAPKTVTLTIDGTPVTVPEGTLLVEAAKTIATDIPVYCYHPKLGPAGLCRICLVEVEKTPKLQIACNTPVSDGMVVHTRGDKVDEGRRAVMEFLLVNHPLDCPICDKGGECDLQDFSVAYGQGASRMLEPKAQKPKAIDLGPTIVLDDERCIVCQRCSRFEEIITHECSLVVKDRGQRDVISTATGAPYVSAFSGNVTELCPVGALTSKTYRFRSRPWDNHRTRTACTQCSVGCALDVDVRHGNITRTMSVEDDPVSDGWLCDRGRYNIGFYDDPRRLTSPLLRVEPGAFVQIGWDDALELWAEKLREAGGAKSAFLGGGRLTNEENLLLAAVASGLGSTSVDWRTGRQRQARHAGARPGAGAFANAQLIVALGRPPSQTAPVLDLRIRKAVLHHGARYVTVGDFAPGAFVPASRVAQVTDLGPHLEGVERVVLVWDGVDVALAGEANELMEALAAKGVSVDALITGEMPNAHGADAFGLQPGAAGGDAILRAAVGGTLATLAIFGANPVLSHPAGAVAVRDALERVGFIVTTELFMTETARVSHLVLPVCGPFEKEGHALDTTGAPVTLRAAQARPEGVLADGEILVTLAAELKLTVPAPHELSERAIAPPASTRAFGDAALARSESGVPASAPGGTPALRLAIAASAFAGGGTSAFDEPFAPQHAQPVAVLARATAASAGVEEGDTLDVTGGERRLPDLVARLDDDVAPGAIVVYDGLSNAPANAFAGGETVRVENVRSATRELTLSGTSAAAGGGEA